MVPRRGSGATVDRIGLYWVILGYAMATGIVVAGALASLYEFVAAEPLRFRPFGKSLAAWLASFLLLAMTGPFIILRSAVHAFRSERSAFGPMALSLLIAGVWSGCSGLILLDLTLTARAGFL
jgi:hypothetical protein